MTQQLFVSHIDFKMSSAHFSNILKITLKRIVNNCSIKRPILKMSRTY